MTLASIAAAASLTFFSATPLPIKGALYAVPLSAVIYTAYATGLRTALVAATLASAYAMLHYDALDAIFPNRGDRLLLGGAVVLVTYGMTIAAGRMRERHDELARRTLEAERAHSAALEQSNRTLQAFTYVVSHDLKEPARALLELARVLQEEHASRLDKDGQDLVARSVVASHRLQTLLAGLLDYSRAAQIGPHEIQELRVEEVVRHSECLMRYENVLRERGGELNVEPGPAVQASLTGLCQAIGNLILNSLKHHPLGGTPRIRVQCAVASDHGFVDVAIEDNGRGYPAALIEDFNRAKRGRPMTLRGGFGLIIAREAVEKMGGRMRLATSQERGARTILTLPAAGPETTGA